MATRSPSGSARSRARCSRCRRARSIRRSIGSRIAAWLAATWAETESGRAAKVYRLTTRGRRQLDQEVADWQRLSEAIGLILQTSE